MARIVIFLRRNGMLVLLTLALSWLTWIQLSTVFEETWRGEIPVRIELEDGDRILTLGEPRPLTVLVEVRGNRRDLDRVTGTLRARFRLRTEELDATQMRQSRTFTASDLILPKEAELLDMAPAEIAVEFAARETKRVEVKVILNTDQKPPDLEFGESLVHPKVVEITGPAAAIREMTSIATLPIDILGILDDLRTAEKPEFATAVSLDLGVAEKDGVTAKPREVNVLIRFEEVYLKTEKIPIEMHWVNPDPEKNKTCYTLVNTAAVEPDAEGTLRIEVLLKGPRATLLDRTKIDRIRAYVRSDDPGAPGALTVHFEGLPDRVVVNQIPGKPDVAPAEFEIQKR